MAMHCYDQRNGKSYFHPTWKGNPKGIFDQRKNGFKPPPFRNHPRNSHQGQQARSGNKPVVAIEIRPKGPFQCSVCGENHMLKD